MTSAGLRTTRMAGAAARAAAGAASTAGAAGAVAGAAVTVWPGRRSRAAPRSGGPAAASCVSGLLPRG
eukprot:53142-Chlamydomonas_euryale.AAC.1